MNIRLTGMRAGLAFGLLLGLGGPASAKGPIQHCADATLNLAHTLQAQGLHWPSEQIAALASAWFRMDTQGCLQPQPLTSGQLAELLHRNVAESLFVGSLLVETARQMPLAERVQVHNGILAALNRSEPSAASELRAGLARNLARFPASQALLILNAYYSTDPAQKKNLIERALAIQPQAAMAWVARAEWHTDREEAPEAVTDLSRALASEPRLAWLYASRAMSLASLNQHAAAERDFAQAQALGWSSEAFYLAWGDSLMRLRQETAAREKWTLGRDSWLKQARQDPAPMSFWSLYPFESRLGDSGLHAEIDALLQQQPQVMELQLLRAEAADFEGDGVAAEAHSRRALELRPQSLEARQVLAHSLLAESKYAEAAAQFHLLQQRLAEAPWLQQTVEEGLMRCAEGMGRKSEARKLIAQSAERRLAELESEPAEEGAYDAFGDWAQEHGLESRWQNWLAARVKARPDDTRAWLALANRYAQAQRWKQAQQAVQALLERTPDAAAALRLQARCLSRLGQRQQAIASLSRLISVGTFDWTDVAERAKLEKAQQQQIQAQADFRLAVATFQQAFFPDEIHASSLFRLHAFFQDMDASAADWLTLLESLGTDFHFCGPLQQALGEAHARAHAYERALADFSRQIELNFEVPSARLGRAQNLYALHQSAEALAEINRLIPQLTDSALWPQIYLLRAYVYTDLAEYRLALEDIDRVLTEKPAEAELYALRGYCHGQLHDTAAALADFRQAVALNPSALNQYNLGLLYRRQGNCGKARKYLNRACAKGHLKACNLRCEL